MRRARSCVRSAGLNAVAPVVRGDPLGAGGAGWEASQRVATDDGCHRGGVGTWHARSRSAHCLASRACAHVRHPLQPPRQPTPSAMTTQQPMPQPLATPIQKKRAAGGAAKKAPKAPPESWSGVFCLAQTTRYASELLGPAASIEDLIACTMMLGCGPRTSHNDPVGRHSRKRCQDAAWLFYQHVEARAADPDALGFLDSITLQQHTREMAAWNAALATGLQTLQPPRWVSVGRDCGHGSDSIAEDCRHLTIEHLQEWKRDLPLYLRAGQQRAYALLAAGPTPALGVLRRRARWTGGARRALLAGARSGRSARRAAPAAPPTARPSRPTSERPTRAPDLRESLGEWSVSAVVVLGT